MHARCEAEKRFKTYPSQPSANGDNLTEDTTQFKVQSISAFIMVLDYFDEIMNQQEVSDEKPKGDHNERFFEPNVAAPTETTSYTVTLLTNEGNFDKVQTLEVDDQQTILEAATLNGIDLPQCCGAGSCSHCVGRVLAGDVEQDDQTVLTERQKDRGFVTLCQAKPKADTVVRTHMFEDLYLSQKLLF